MPAASAATSSSGCTAWARRSTSCCSPSGRTRRAGLCAGRRPSRPAGLSGAAAAGERRQLVVRVGGGGSGGAGRRSCSSARRPGSATPGTPAIPKIPLPRDLYGPSRRNSPGVEFGDRASLAALVASARGAVVPRLATPLVDGIALPGIERDVRSPIDGTVIGRVREADEAIAAAAMTAASAAFRAGARPPVEDRAAALERASDLLEARSRPPDRAAAGRGRQDARRCARRGARGHRLLPLLRGRGAHARWRRSRCPGRPAKPTSCAIAAAACSSASARGISRSRSFSARSTAALAAGNTVVAKPAEQTPLIAVEAVRLLHQAGIPESALHLVAGDGKVGAALVGRSARRRRRLHRLDRGRARDQPRARRQGRRRSCR